MEIGKNIDVKKRREKGLVCTETMSRQSILEMSCNEREQKVYQGRCTNREDCFFFKKNGHPRPLFSLFSSFQYTIDSNQMFNINKFLLMTGFEPWTSGIRSDRTPN